MEEAKQKLSFLVEEIKRTCEGSNVRRLDYKKKAFRSYMATSMLAAVSVIILGIKFESVTFLGIVLDISTYAKTTALVINASISVINAYNMYYDHKDMWIANNKTMNALKKLIFDIEFAQTGTGAITLEQITKWKDDYQEIMDNMNATWEKFRAEKK